ncbi:glycosyltransferase family 32 protein [Paracoccus laeviglucosivorans]|uniref:Glycosyltransferase sugar-binding region containing DXD motif-containing protein n=1 Tax=Paracoccus laeviglucosivorans TaxID=1197861 RepID=A0A521D2Q5_9RHOB|nr:glycosyltransferase [Paracoccus laeviglucosivorans]SMO65973.1 Glycosyltransferase sugar-binding region containing DXD motif-containing protein [Paracoccus laeviglucosivorans]
MQPKDKAWFDARLRQLQAMIDAGDFAGAGALADALTTEQTDAMGPPTLAGVPRRLHAARLRLARAQGDQIAKLGWQAMQGPGLDGLLPLATLTAKERQQAAAMAGTPVPRILHQIWIGDLPPPPSVAAWRAWCILNGREYQLWDEAALDRIGATTHPVYRQMLAQGDYPGAVDVARYLVLEAAGGLYLDADFHPARDDADFDDYIAPFGLAALAEDTPRITGRGALLLTNALISTPAGHPALSALIRALPQAVAALPRAPAWWVTGPLIFTLFARLCPLGLAAHDIVAGRLPRGADGAELQRFRRGPGLLIDWKSW